MKRDRRLVHLSREHHAALRLGRYLLKGGASAALCEQADALAAHFTEEERTLLPLLEANGQHTLARRLTGEHAMLAGLFAHAKQGRGEAEAGQALIDHVRFEERELFPAVERLLGEAAP
ncbi:hemerythrin HHE cation-binding protein [Pseudothauera nasutitermitis]|uniref:Hemerythrin HHE cation-binding protein n=1 Tax=Pseudothauera nasutitermitis TaxID=2565930 RepID=A0A4S4B418_9RHOO|nr:hemerythrin domain-containing protein [Pseudothauera nasutitermitis]THF67021.1 hemerythrin HHE cation-binding protein [Pseudothauera nasutitermitis]